MPSAGLAGRLAPVPRLAAAGDPEPSHHPLLAFVAGARMVANFWLRPGNAHRANNILQFLESTFAHPGEKVVGLLRADSGFFDDAVLSALEGKRIPSIIAARLTQPLAADCGGPGRLDSHRGGIS